MMTNSLTFTYNLSSNIGADENGAILFNIEHPQETLLAKNLSEHIFELVRDLVQFGNFTSIQNICLSTVGVFNIIDCENLYNSYQDSTVFNLPMKNDTLYLMDLDSYIWRKDGDKFKNIRPSLISHVLNLIKNDSFLVFASSEFDIESCDIESDQALIEKHGLHIHASLYFQANPYGSLMAESVETVSEKPSLNYGFYLLFVSPIPSSKIFVRKFSTSKKENPFVSSFKDQISRPQPNPNQIQDPYAGFWISRNDFLSWTRYDLQKEYMRLKAYFNEYKFEKLKNLIISPPTIQYSESKFHYSAEGSVFLKLQNLVFGRTLGGKFKFYKSNIADSTSREFIKLDFDTSKINPNYFLNFFETRFGHLSLYFSMPIFEVINLQKSIIEMEIPVPEKKTQNSIVTNVQKLLLTKEKIKQYAELDMQTVFFSNYISNFSEKIDQILSIFDGLTDAEKILKLITGGESKTVEFKQTLSLDIKTGVKAKYIEDAIIKTIAAFLNSDGGTLLVGVDDTGQIIGLNNEISLIFSNRDKFLLHLKNLIMSRIGADLYPKINQRLLLVNEAVLLVIECQPSDVEVYVDNKDFYVRTNPSTDKLEGPRLVGYIKNRFKL